MNVIPSIDEMLRRFEECFPALENATAQEQLDMLIVCLDASVTNLAALVSLWNEVLGEDETEEIITRLRAEIKLADE